MKFDNKEIIRDIILYNIADADDVAILLQGKYRRILCDLMENAFTILTKWATNCGLGVKQNQCYLQDSNLESKFNRQN